ncbi:hypothetical protein K1T71_002518 [Dendrolimus kikuchii]|uniref:Uncharacterized protein n=1 Tax=Dendrolimus kikuchii TaxID=765133 RepID=A0ACC1DD81_9NEOP|nr:hypothetical protein K1T71_002518 [Dendrolimus kikuchii]
MDTRAAKLALARKKLKDHQDRKLNSSPKSSLFISSDLDLNHGYTTESLSTLTNPLSLNEEILNQDPDKNPPHLQQSLNVSEYMQPETSVTEILISSKRNMESQIHILQTQLSTLEDNHNITINNYKSATQKIHYLESDLENLNIKYSDATRQLMTKDEVIKELNAMKKKLSDENINYQEQLEFTKTILTAKEAENNSLHSQLYNLQNQFDATVLQLQQLNNGSTGQLPNSNGSMQQVEVLKQKNLDLEQHLKVLQKERDQINSHYEHYTNELNEQLRCVVKRNENLTKEIHDLSNRENNLIDQISDMEIRLQSYINHKNENNNVNVDNITDYNQILADLSKAQENFQDLSLKHDKLQKSYSECITKLKDMEEVKESDHELNISLTKLNADIASDKVAAQIATEQNRKLKEDMQRLEEAFVKMSKDKLELTEKLTAEKFLTRELTLKLADIEEKAKESENKLKAKDGEMIRLQANCRSTAEKYEILLKQSQIINDTSDVNSNKITSRDSPTDTEVPNSYSIERSESKVVCDQENEVKFEKQDAMKKLQDRFLKIMDEVANLSDEKHRLEHIILQLQNETDTICEYVALYQQQRSLLKRRDEERSAQLKIFQSECERLRNQLDELTSILLRFVEDKDLSLYFQAESKRIDKEKVMSLLSTLKTNSIIDPTQNTLDFKAFYPCNCCSVPTSRCPSSDDEEDHVPLAQMRRTVFQQLMPTPAKNTEKTLTVRRKAINYRGTPVTKDLFEITKKEKKIKKTSIIKDTYDTEQNDASWYCHACEEDKMKDMMPCLKCGKWYHGECVGLTVDDTDNFECPDGY